MTRYQDTTWCDNCGAEITWLPIVDGRNHYCCWECKNGYRCECVDLMVLDDDRRIVDASFESLSAFYDQ